MYKHKNAIRRHEREAGGGGGLTTLLLILLLRKRRREREKTKTKKKKEEEEEEGFVLSPRSRKLLRVGVDGNGRGRQQKQQQREHEERKRYARVDASQREREIEIEEEKEEEEKNERRRMRNGKRDGTSSLSLLGLAEFTYCTRSALLVAAARERNFYDLGGGDSDLTETTTMINGTSSSSSISSNKSDLESIFAVASAHTVLVLISDVLAQKKYIENALDASVSVVLRVFALLLGTAMWFSIAFLFGSSVIASSEKQRATVAFAYFMSSLTVLPGTHAASRKRWCERETQRNNSNGNKTGGEPLRHR